MMSEAVGWGMGNVSDAELFFTLASQTRPVSQNRAYHVFLVWMDGKDESRSFGQRIATLEQRGILDRNWAHDPLKAVSRGRLASMICRKLNLKTSVMLWLAGPSERAARRELIYREIMIAGGSDGDPLSGAEFVNILKRADEYGQHRPIAPRTERVVE